MSEHDKARFLIRILLAQPDAQRILALHRWPNETDRWHELVHALLNPILPLSDLHVRAIVDRLAILELLDSSAWASASEHSTIRQRLVAVLTAEGLERTVAERAAAVLAEAARSLARGYGGKAQRCLRAVGEQALAMLGEAFDLPSLGKTASREALTVWLQNVANMPISLADESVIDYCNEQEVSLDELVQAADEIELNIAVLDDLVHSWRQSGRSDNNGQPGDE